MPLSFGATLILLSHSEFSVHLVSSQGVVLLALSLVLLLNDVSSHIVHELLSTTLTGNKLTLAILFLFVKHASVFLLRLHIELALTLLISHSLLFVHFILNKHLLEVFSFLVALIGLQVAFGFHFLLESFNKINLLLEGILLIGSAFALFLHQLAVTRFLLLSSLDSS